MGTLASALGPVARELTGAPRVYVDANVPAGLVGLMRHELGWDVLSVVEHDDLRRAPDEEHFRRAFDLSRTLVTLDHDYFDTRRFPDFQNPGVIVCTAPDERRLASLLRELHASAFAQPDRPAQPFKGKTVALVAGEPAPVA